MARKLISFCAAIALILWILVTVVADVNHGHGPGHHGEHGEEHSSEHGEHGEGHGDEHSEHGEEHSDGEHGEEGHDESESEGHGG